MEDIDRMAAAQTAPVAGDIAANLRQHLLLVEAAAAQSVTLLVFPELSLTGYELAMSPQLALEPDDARLAPLVEAARLHGMTLVVGAPVRAPSGLHIAAFMIEPTGALHLYTKHHLGAFQPEHHPDGAIPPPESSYFHPGVQNPLVTWRGRTLAASICADSAHPSHAQIAAERGATIYLSSQFAIPVHMPFKLSRLKAAARQYGLTVIFSNFGGPTGGLSAGGGSCVLSVEGEAVARLPHEGCGLAIAWRDAAGWKGKTVLVEPIRSSPHDV